MAAVSVDELLIKVLVNVCNIKSEDYVPWIFEQSKKNGYQVNIRRKIQ